MLVNIDLETVRAEHVYCSIFRRQRNHRAPRRPKQIDLIEQDQGTISE
jgi:hypothetical protein